MRADSCIGIKKNSEADGYLFVSVSGNRSSISSFSFSEREERINFRCFFLISIIII